MKELKKGVLLSILSGVLISLCFEPFGLSFLCFVAYVPLLFAFHYQKSIWKLLLCAWITIFIQSLMSFQWIHFVAREFGSLPWVVSFLVLVGFALFTNLFLHIFAVFYYFLKKRINSTRVVLLYFLILPAAYVISEAVDPRIFNWYIGDAFSSYKYMMQFADVFGVYGLSFLCFVVNTSVFLVLKKKTFAYLIPALVIPLFLLSYGWVRYHNIEEYQRTCPVINVGVVQANIGNPVQLKIAEVLKFKKELGLTDAEYASDSDLILQKYNLMTKQVLEKYPNIDIIVWPETAFPGYYVERNKKMRAHLDFVKELGKPFFIGGYYYEPFKDGGKYYNSAILISNDTDIQYYHKHVLLPFGEFMPLGSIFPKLKELVPAVGDFGSGTGPMLLKSSVAGLEINFAPNICYEVLKPSYVRRTVMLGANLIFNFTNDSWFGSIEPYQHLRLSVMRAVENRRPIVRSTNTGVSAFIDMNGVVISKSDIGVQETLKFEAPVCEPNVFSFYSKYGWSFVYLLGLFITGLFLYPIIIKRVKK